MQIPPFNIKDNNNALLISRFLIEDNNDDYIIYFDSQKCDLKTITSRFKWLIQKYNITTAEQDKKMHKNLVRVIAE